MARLIFLLATFLTGCLMAAPFTFKNTQELPGNFRGGGCAVGGSLTACGTLNSLPGALVGGNWISFSNLPTGANFVSGSGYNQTTVWSTSAGGIVCVSFTCQQAAGWIPLAVAPNGDVGGQCASGAACVNGSQLPNSPIAASIFGYAAGGWVGSTYDPSGGGNAVQFNADGTISITLPCASGFCGGISGDVEVNTIGFQDGSNYFIRRPDGSVVPVPGRPTTLASGHVTTPQGLGPVGGTITIVLSLTGGPVQNPRLITDGLRTIGTGQASLWMGELRPETTVNDVNTPEISSGVGAFAGLALLAFARWRRRKR